jgi:hypothetical protein
VELMEWTRRRARERCVRPPLSHLAPIGRRLSDSLPAGDWLDNRWLLTSGSGSPATKLAAGNTHRSIVTEASRHVPVGRVGLGDRTQVSVGPVARRSVAQLGGSGECGVGWSLRGHRRRRSNVTKQPPIISAKLPGSGTATPSFWPLAEVHSPHQVGPTRSPHR